MTDETWAPMSRHEWPEHARLTEPEGDTVRVVTADEYDRIRDDEVRPARTPSVSSLAPVPRGPALLAQRTNAADNHAQRVAGLLTALKAADDFLSVPKSGARDWAADLRYGDTVIEEINKAVAAIHKALDLVDLHEAR